MYTYHAFLKTLDSYWWVWALIASVFTLGLTVILGLGQSVWFDEGYSILLAQQPWGELFALTAVDAHPPLYYALLKIWGEIFGFGELALRSLSGVLLAGAVFAGAGLVRTITSARIATAILPFLVLAPFALRYGYEIRMYALALLIGVLATWVLVVATRTNRWRHWAIYAVLVTLGMLTLYLTVAVWLTHAVWLLVRSLRAKKPVKTWRWLVAYIGAVVLFIPYMPTFFSQLFNSVLPGIGSALTLTKLVDVYSMQFLFTPEYQVGGWASVALLTVLVLWIILLVRVLGAVQKEQRAYVWLMIVMLVGPMSFFMLTSLVGPEPIFIVRYVAHVSLFIPLLLGVSIALGWHHGLRKTSLILATLSIGVLATGVFNVANTGNFNFERLQQPSTTELRSVAQCDDATVVADDPYTYIDTVYYFGDCDLRFFSEDSVERKGGYAPLANSEARVESGTVFESQTLYHIRWFEAEPSFVVSGDYIFVDSIRFDKQVLDRYIRTSAE